MKKINELANCTNNIEAEQMYYLKSIINNSDFIYTIISEHKQIPVSSKIKIKTRTSIFFDLIEIINNLSLVDVIKKSNVCLHISEQCSDTVKATKYYNEEDNILKQYIMFDDIENVLVPDNYIDYCFIEIKITDILNPNEYSIQLIKTLHIITKRLKIGSTFIMKMDYLFYKPIVDFLFIMSCMFEKIYITKPTTSNLLTFEKYIICKNLNNIDIDMSFYNEDFLNMLESKHTVDINANITSFINEDIPYYFINKLTEIDVMLGQYQLESIQEIINIINSKNKNDKIENLKKNNIQKGIAWCNKYKIPYNIFLEKKNAFLHDNNNNELLP
jgi:hypothetical protein